MRSTLPRSVDGNGPTLQVAGTSSPPRPTPFLYSAEINDREEEWREIEHHITDIKRDRAISRDKIVPNFLYI